VAGDIRAIIVDDEPLARRGLVIRLAQADGIDVVAEYGNGRDAVSGVRELKPDLVFLDIQMPVMDGFEVLKALQGPDMPIIVFVTAYDQYALKAFDAHALDYVLKPIDDDRFRNTLTRVREELDQREAGAHRQKLLELLVEVSGRDSLDLDELLAQGREALEDPYLDVLPIRDAGTTVCVKVNEIDWIDAAGDYMCVHAAGQTHVMRGTMKKLEAVLHPKRFQRVHRSTIVNVDRVREVRSHINGEFFLILGDGIELKMSRHYKDRIHHFVPAV
jgi:two-component system LytT family response regulator